MSSAGASPEGKSKADYLKERADDLRVREQIKQRDSVSIESVKNDLAKEEKELKDFFKPHDDGDPKSEDNDPTIMRKQRY